MSRALGYPPPVADVFSRSGHGYATPEILAYLDDLHGRHDAGLAQAFDAPGAKDIPAIQVGRSEGLLLEWLTRAHRVTRAVEVGTLAGYSAIRIARGLGPGGRLYTLERDPKHAAIARENIAAAGLADRVEVLLGDATDSLAHLGPSGPFDLVFVDADKDRYDHYGRWAAANLRPGGLLIGDNVYFFGKLLDAEGGAAAAMRRFHEEARAAFDTCVVPTPDGLLLGVRR